MKIAIIDDEKQARETLAEILELVGFETFIVEKSFNEVNDLADYIESHAQAAICDHRLSDRGLAPFTGSELMPSLYNKQFPSLLMTQYTDRDINDSIRKYRDKIPIVLERDELVDLYDIDIIGDKITRGIETCSQEFQHIMSSVRRPHRTFVRIVSISNGLVDALVPSWKPYHAVSFPVSLIPEEFSSNIESRLKQKEDIWLIACVNTGAEKPDDLYFTKFEAAPELDDNDGLT
jgi:CheY-like chemotaxis protein